MHGRIELLFEQLMKRKIIAWQGHRGNSHIETAVTKTVKQCCRDLFDNPDLYQRMLAAES